MIDKAASRAWWHAVGAPLERRVRPHSWWRLECRLDHGEVECKIKLELMKDLQRLLLQRKDGVCALRQATKANIGPRCLLNKSFKLLSMRSDLAPEPLKVFVVARALTQRRLK